MSLQFMSPAFLWGALLAAVPVIIHLINRRRARRVEFAAIAFVLRSQQRNARRLRLRRLLLLAARTLLFLAVPLALARPYLAPEQAAVAKSTRGPTAVAVVLDTSMSMRYRLGGERVFDRAKDEALEVVDSVSPEDAVAVLPCADGWDRALPTTTYDLAEAKALVKQAEPTFRGSDLTACVGAAARVLSGSPLEGKRIVVVTDLTASGWRLDAPPPVVGEDARPEIRFVDATGGRPLPNRWVEGLDVEPAFGLGPRGYAFGFNVRASDGASGENLSAALEADGKILSRGFVELPENGTARKTLSHQFAAGGEVIGRVHLAEDGLPEDDGRPFVLSVARDLKALVVDGAPSVNRYEDEVFFVERALSPGRGPGSAVRATVVDPDGLATADLSRYDLVFLLNVHRVPQARAGDLKVFVQRGGGLFVSAGDKVDADAWNASLGDLLPALLHVPKAGDGRPAALAAVRWDHPIFQVFVGPGREGFASARFQKYLLTRPPKADTTVLATYDDGAPAFLARPYGRGRVLLFTSTVDRDWSDLSIRTAFLPLVQQAAGWLARDLDGRSEAVVRVGAEVPLTVPTGTTELVVADPDKHTTGFKGDALASGKVVFGQTQVPGVYRVLARREGADLAPAEGLSFVVTTDPAESDTTRIDPEELLAWAGSSGEADAGLSIASLGGGDGTGRRPLWTWLLVLAALAIVGEGWLLRRA